MFFTLLKVELRKHCKFFGFLIVINLLSSILVLKDYEFMNTYGFDIEYYSWILAFLYVFINVYRELYIGKNLLSHMVPIETSRLLVIKSLVFGIFMSIIWLTTLIYEIHSPMGIYQMKIIHSSSILQSTLYFILPRIISLFTGVIIIGFSISLGKVINNKVVSKVIVFGSFILITMALYFTIKYSLINQNGVGWAIGTTAQYGFKQYSGIIAMLVTSPKTQALAGVDIATSIYWNNIFINIIAGVVGLYASHLIFKSKRYELIGK